MLLKIDAQHGNYKILDVDVISEETFKHILIKIKEKWISEHIRIVEEEGKKRFEIFDSNNNVIDRLNCDSVGEEELVKMIGRGEFTHFPIPLDILIKELSKQGIYCKDLEVRQNIYYL